MPLKVYQTAPPPWPQTINHEAAAKASHNNQQTISKIATTALASGREESTNPIPRYADTVNSPYRYNTPLTQNDIKNIHILFEKLGKTSIFFLAFRRKEMEELGKRLDLIHPLSVWKHVMTTPELKSYVDEIKKKNIVWDSLLKQCARKLKFQYSQANLTTDNVEDFLNSLHRPIDLKINENTNWLHFLQSALY